MHRLWMALLACAGLASVSASGADLASEKPKVPECFKVHRLLKTDEAHYWADWTNSCPYTIDSVYVLVRFFDHARKQLSEGVWPMYFILPGVHRVTRFSIPAAAEGFEFIGVRRITTNSVEALR